MTETHKELEHNKFLVLITLYQHTLTITCPCGHDTNMHKDLAGAEKEYMQHLKEEH